MHLPVWAHTWGDAMQYFDQSYYLRTKIAQLNSINYKPSGGGAWTEEKLVQELADAGFTPLEHYLAAGRAEGLGPNAYFNEKEYLAAKANQLNSLKINGKTGWTAEEALDAILAAGFSSPAEHYERHGAFETDAEGNYINPSNAFDANAYWSAKLLQVQRSGMAVGGKTGAAISLDDMTAVFSQSGLSPVSHYSNIGAGEANETGIAYVQTVPSGQRVPGDAYRETLGECVPANYGSNTRAPAQNAPRPAPAPADVGGLADEAVSPVPVIPAANLPVPGDALYVPLPINVTANVAGQTIIPPTTTGSEKVSDNFLVADLKTGTATVVGPDGSIKGQTKVTVTEGDYGISVTASLGGATASLPAVNAGDLAAGVTVLDYLDNNFVPEASLVQFNGELPGSIIVAGDIPTGEKAGFAVDDAGEIVSRLNAEASNVRLIPKGMIDASDVTGTGTLSISTAAFADEHSVVGSAAARNALTLGLNATEVSGGAGADSFTIHAEHAQEGLTINLGGTRSGDAADRETVALSSAAGSDVSIDAVIGQDDIFDNVLIQGAPGAALQVGRVELGEGDNALALQNAVVETLSGAGNNTITVGGGASVTGDIVFGDGVNSIEVLEGGSVKSITGGADFMAVTVAGTVLEGITADTGNCNITLKTGSAVGDGETALSAGALSSGSTVRIEAGATVKGAILADTGNDYLFLSGAGSFDFGAGNVTGFEFLNLNDPEVQRVTMHAGFLSHRAEIHAYRGDSVIFAGLKTAVTTGASGVTSDGQWYFNNTEHTLTYREDGARLTVQFAQAGSMSQTGAGAVWEYASGGTDETVRLTGVDGAAPGTGGVFDDIPA